MSKDAELRFVTEYTRRLDDVASSNDPEESEEKLKKLHFWAARQSLKERDRAARALNSCLGLHGKHELHGDLPCITAGSRKGLVIMSANPGWGEDASKEFEDACAGKPSEYWHRTTGYFDETPCKLRNARWWGRAFPYLELLEGSGYRGERGKAAWAFAHGCKKFGAWELIPIPSSKDRITSRLHLSPELTSLAEASVKAILALKPVLLLVGHKHACKVVKEIAPGPWAPQVLPGSVILEHCRCPDGNEIVLIPIQFISAPHKFTRQDVTSAVESLRRK